MTGVGDNAVESAAAFVLTSRGLSVIVEANDLSRKIFRQMKKTSSSTASSHVWRRCALTQRSFPRSRRWNAVTLETSCWQDENVFARCLVRRNRVEIKHAGPDVGFGSSGIQADSLTLHSASLRSVAVVLIWLDDWCRAVQTCSC